MPSVGTGQPVTALHQGLVVLSSSLRLVLPFGKENGGEGWGWRLERCLLMKPE